MLKDLTFDNVLKSLDAFLYNFIDKTSYPVYKSVLVQFYLYHYKLDENVKSINALQLNKYMLDSLEALKSPYRANIEHNSFEDIEENEEESLEALNDVEIELIKSINALNLINKKSIEDFIEIELAKKSRYDSLSMYTKKNNINVLRRYLKHVYNYEIENIKVFDLIMFLEEHYRLDLKSLDIKTISTYDYKKIKTSLIEKTQKLLILDFDENRSLEENRKALSRKFGAMRNSLALKLVAFAGIKSEELKSLRINGIKELELSYELKLKRRVEKDNETHRKLRIKKYLVRDEVENLKRYFKAFNRPDELFLVSSRNEFKPMDNKDISYFVRKFFKELEIQVPKDSKVGLYLLRHSYALELISLGKTNETMRRRLGLVKNDMVNEYRAYYREMIDDEENI